MSRMSPVLFQLATSLKTSRAFDRMGAGKALTKKGREAYEKKSMSVMEMGRMLGLKKTNSYWLIKKGWFETVMVAGKMRVMVDSFEEWYQSQTHYRKVNAVESHGMQ